MTDDLIDTLIWQELQKMEIILNNMIRRAVDVSDEKPFVGKMPKETITCKKMKRVLCMELESADADDDYQPLKISIQEFFCYWLQHCVKHKDFINRILDDIYTHITKNVKKKRKATNPSINFHVARHRQSINTNTKRIKKMKGHRESIKPHRDR